MPKPQPPKKRVTIKDVAREAGVAFKTVSRVINNDTTVTTANREKIQAAIKQLNYRVDSSARNLRSNSSFTLGLIYDRLNAFYIVNIQNGAIKVCQETHYSLQILPLYDEKSLDATELAGIATSARISGFIITPPFSEKPDLIEGLREHKIPFVRIISNSDMSPDTADLVVQIDDYTIGKRLTEYLLELGHSRIAFLWGQVSHRTSIDRHRGFLAAMENSKTPINENYVLKGEYTYQSGYDRALKLFAQPTRPTAIITSNDDIAAGVIAAANRSGIKVPDDLSVIGIRNTPLAHQTFPRVTGFDLDAEELSATATRLLISHLSSQEDSERVINFKLQFNERESTAKPPEA